MLDKMENPHDTVAIKIRIDRPDSAAGRRLIGLLDEDLLARYPSQLIHGLNPQDASDTYLLFLIASVGGQDAGCGAVRPLEPGVGEVKRMFVRPEFRGRGIARIILQALEAESARLGYGALRLETGTRQPEAIALYTSAGYSEIPRFGEYSSNPTSVCFEKRVMPSTPS
jgi:putative acetyltransferase